MSQRIAYFHVGMPKTGTTAIQESLAHNRQELKRNGLLYPGAAVDHADLIPALHQDGAAHFYHRNRGIAETEAAAIGSKTWNAVKREIAEFDGNLIFSSEYFHNMNQHAIRALQSEFDALGYKMIVIIYLRHPVPAAVSGANQNIKMGKRLLQECVDEPRWHDNRASLQRFWDTLPRDQLIVRDYEAVRKRDSTRDLLDTINYKGEIEAAKVLEANVSVTMAGAVIADACTRAKRADPKFRINRKQLYKIGGPKFMLPAASLEQVRTNCKAELDWLENTAGIKLIEPEMKGEYFNTLDAAAVLEVITYIGSLQHPIVDRVKKLVEKQSA
jgi:hypothetical protein